MTGQMNPRSIPRLRLPAPDKGMDSTWRWIALLVYGLALGLLMERHVFWRDEVHAWQIAVYDNSLASLFHDLQYDGHPALWFLLLRGLNALFHSPHALPAAHWLVASLNAFLILWYCPIPPWQRIACCFGYFMMFEFGVISRGYALEPFVALLFVAIHTRCRLAITGPALLLALLVHTNIPGAFIALSLLAYWVTRLWGEGREARRRIWVPVATVCASTIAMLLYIEPPPDSLFANLYREYRQQLTPLEAIRNARMFLRVVAPVPRLDTIHFWNTNWAEAIPLNAHPLTNQSLLSILCLTLAV